MALLLIDGFEQYGLAAQLFRGGWNPSLTSTLINFPTGRHGSGSRAVENGFNSATIKHTFTSTDFFVVGFAYRQSITPLATLYSVQLLKGANVMISIVVTAAGELQLRRGPTTQLAITSGLGLTIGAWAYIECKVTIHDTAGAYECQVDGVSVFSDSSVDTREGSDTEVDVFSMVGRTTQDPQWDDIYILDDAGSDNTDFLGDCRVETIFPDADGNEVDFTRVGGGSNNWEAVDDGLTLDHDTTYNHSSTVTDRDLYGFAALTGDIDTIFGVDAKMLVRKDDAGFRQVRAIARSNTTEVEGSIETLGLDWKFVQHLMENNPDGGGDWTETTVNAAQFGLDLQA